MVFQKLALITLAAAGFASAMAVERRGDATCTFTVVASAAPSPGPVSLETEFNYLLGREFASQFTGNSVNGAASVVTGPAPTNVYTVVKGFSVDDSLASDSDVKALVEGWAGKTFDGPWSGVAWAVQSVAC
ncbi:hypothetical protein BKA70DRAFT_1401035 [Coprinopsis sp. MPI-PUGE-AT-0042]|nr:hypothetical protein BKA70DRAFT_1401035 [Coprinopsis sp. MPI-PUGE-AT-0042]